jgi:hypothetical protein
MKKPHKPRSINHDFVAMPTRKAKAPIAAHAPDRYDSRENDGSAFAAAVLAWQHPTTGTMPVPPGRRA